MNNEPTLSDEIETLTDAERKACTREYDEAHGEHPADKPIDDVIAAQAAVSVYIPALNATIAERDKWLADAHEDVADSIADNLKLRERIAELDDANAAQAQGARGLVAENARLTERIKELKKEIADRPEHRKSRHIMRREERERDTAYRKQTEGKSDDS